MLSINAPRSAVAPARIASDACASLGSAGAVPWAQPVLSPEQRAAGREPGRAYRSGSPACSGHIGLHARSLGPHGVELAGQHEQPPVTAASHDRPSRYEVRPLSLSLPRAASWPALAGSDGDIRGLPTRNSDQCGGYESTSQGMDYWCASALLRGGASPHHNRASRSGSRSSRRVPRRRSFPRGPPQPRCKPAPWPTPSSVSGRFGGPSQTSTIGRASVTIRRSQPKSALGPAMASNGPCRGPPPKAAQTRRRPAEVRPRRAAAGSAAPAARPTASA